MHTVCLRPFSKAYIRNVLPRRKEGLWSHSCTGPRQGKAQHGLERIVPVPHTCSKGGENWQSLQTYRTSFPSEPWQVSILQCSRELRVSCENRLVKNLRSPGEMNFSF